MAALHSLPEKKYLNRIYQQISPFIRVTPLIELESLSQWIQGRVLVKAESLQKTGAFKFRGALHRLANLSENEKKHGVAAYSSGNFAAGLAAAGQQLNIPVSLVMPHDAPQKKIRNAQRYGGKITLCHEQEPSREEAASQMARTIAQSSGATLLHPFDDPIIIEGQASVGVELEQQLKSGGARVDLVLCPVGGGSLVAGCSLVFRDSLQVLAVEAAGFDGMKQSIEAGSLCRANGNQPTDCDALMALQPGKANLEVVLNTGVKGMSVSPAFIHKAVRLAFEEMNLLLEPSGAIALAAILQEPDRFRNKAVVAIATGGNIDSQQLASILGSEDPQSRSSA